jgi:hydroxyacylglutathione hydrolase
MIKIYKFIFNPFAENTYIIWDELSGKAIIIDPGCSNQNEENRLKEFIFSNNLSPEFLINTHCHIDHIMGNKFVKEEFKVDLISPEEDIFLIKSQGEQAGLFGLEIKKSPYPDKYLSEDLILNFNGIGIKFLHTPGHSPGGYSIYFPNDKVCFTGDTLFRDAIGRTDLYHGDYKTLIDSIHAKLFSLPDEVIIYPGHGEESTIGYEKKFNQFLI